MHNCKDHLVDEVIDYEKQGDIISELIVYCSVCGKEFEPEELQKGTTNVINKNYYGAS